MIFLAPIRRCDLLAADKYERNYRAGAILKLTEVIFASVAVFSSRKKAPATS